MKEAYLVIAHNQWNMVKKLISYLDSQNTDIYLHVNSLVDMPNLEEFSQMLEFSNLYIVDRKVIVWGGYGYMEAIFAFFRQSFPLKYTYYHLLSGVDIPLKTTAHIKKFLEENSYKNKSNYLRTNYLNCHVPYNKSEYYPVAQYNLFVSQWRNPNPIVRKAAKGSALILNIVQNILGINRIKELHMDLYKGDAFFSFSHEFVEYIISMEQWSNYNFSKYTFAPEEYIFQTLLMNSKFKDSLPIFDNENITDNLRHIDFKRGTPWTWKYDDLEELTNTEDFFARKFDPNIDNRIIESLYEKVKKE